MMGPEKLSTMRKRVRESYKMTDAQLLAHFNERIKKASRKSEDNQVVIETLRLFRDALVKESKKPAPRRKARPKVRCQK
jgi:hypothetical protein